MKSKIKSLSLFILLISSLTLIAGCAMDTSTPKIEKCTITYDINLEGQTAPESKEVTIGTKLSADNLLKAPANVDGYKFSGWCLDDAIVSKDYEVKTNITLKAKWLKCYTITYVLDTGKTQEAIYTVEDEVNLITPPNKEGYSFAGWYEKEDFSGNKVTQILKGTTGNKTYYANFIKFKTVDEAATYLQSLEQNGSTYDLYVQVNNDSDITKLKDELKKLDYSKILINMYLKPGEGVTTVPEVGFYTAHVLKKVELLNGFTILKNDAFKECTSLEEIILPSSLTSISDFAIAICTALKTIDLPKSIKTIGAQNFNGNATLNYKGTKQEFLNIKYNLNNFLPKIQCSDGQLLESQMIENSLNNISIPDTVTDDYMRISVPFNCYRKQDFVIEYKCDDIMWYGEELLVKRLDPNTSTKKSVITLTLRNHKNITRSIDVTINHESDVNKAVANLVTDFNDRFGYQVRDGYKKLVLEDTSSNSYSTNQIWIHPQEKIISFKFEEKSTNCEYNYEVTDDLKFTLTSFNNAPTIITNKDTNKFELYIKKDFVNNESNSSIEIYKPNTPNDKTVYQ